jgi:hypothetical protein
MSQYGPHGQTFPQQQYPQRKCLRALEGESHDEHDFMDEEEMDGGPELKPFHCIGLTGISPTDTAIIPVMSDAEIDGRQMGLMVSDLLMMPTDTTLPVPVIAGHSTGEFPTTIIPPSDDPGNQFNYPPGHCGMTLTHKGHDFEVSDDGWYHCDGENPATQWIAESKDPLDPLTGSQSFVQVSAPPAPTPEPVQATPALRNVFPKDPSAVYGTYENPVQGVYDKPAIHRRLDTTDDGIHYWTEDMSTMSNGNKGDDFIQQIGEYHPSVNVQIERVRQTRKAAARASGELNVSGAKSTGRLTLVTDQNLNTRDRFVLLDDENRPLLHLRVNEDGKVDAKYYAGDLTEAAERFIQFLKAMD